MVDRGRRFRITFHRGVTLCECQDVWPGDLEKLVKEIVERCGGMWRDVESVSVAVARFFKCKDSFEESFIIIDSPTFCSSFHCSQEAERQRGHNGKRHWAGFSESRHVQTGRWQS